MVVFIARLPSQFPAGPAVIQTAYYSNDIIGTAVYYQCSDVLVVSP